MKLTLALAALLAVISCTGCSTPQPNPNPALRAQLHQTLTGHSAQVWSVVFSPDGEYLASGSVDKTVRLWRLPEGVLAQTLAHPEGVTFVAFSRDGRWLASGSREKGALGTLWKQIAGGRLGGGKGQTVRL